MVSTNPISSSIPACKIPITIIIRKIRMKRINPYIYCVYINKYPLYFFKKLDKYGGQKLHFLLFQWKRTFMQRTIEPILKKWQSAPKRLPLLLTCLCKILEPIFWQIGPLIWSWTLKFCKVEIKRSKTSWKKLYTRSRNNLENFSKFFSSDEAWRTKQT